MHYFRKVNPINFCPPPPPPPPCPFLNSQKVEGLRKAILSLRTYLLFMKLKGNLVPPDLGG
jgi:hypothetical protein